MDVSSGQKLTSAAQRRLSGRHGRGGDWEGTHRGGEEGEPAGTAGAAGPGAADGAGRRGRCHAPPSGTWPGGALSPGPPQDLRC